jgi:hypothetical protein
LGSISIDLRKHPSIYKGRYHFKVAGSEAHDPVQVLLYSARPTHAVGAGSAGQPVVGSQHNTPPAPLVLFDTTAAVGVAKTQFPVEQPHGAAIQPC